MVVLHYTGMADAASAIARVTDPEAKVSAHYLIAEDGQVVRMVDERLRAWHAGQSYWRRITDVNSASVGIEIVNPGHELGYRPFPEAQMAAPLPLLSEILGRHGVPPAKDRKSVVSGKRVYGRVDLGGRRIVENKKQTKKK